MKNILQNEHIIPIDVLLNYAMNEYFGSDQCQLKKLRKISLIKKLWNERKIKRLFDKFIKDTEPYKTKVQKELNSYTDFNSPEMKEIKCIVTDFMLEMDKRKLLFDRPFLEFFMEQGYLNIAEEFILDAKEEDSQLKAEEIFQAIRNVWIMNSLQIFWGLSLELTPSVYAYSMLYPYTDNFLDNPKVKVQEKVEFNKRLSKVLNGEELSPTNSIEERVFSLVDQIKTQYSRDTYPEVFQSLYLIQEAQIKSMKQDEEQFLTSDQILSISFFKGGTSVLADAFLVKGNLNMDEMHFAFAYGAFLQLLDDLQDAKDDKKDKHQTLFSTIEDKSQIDYEVIKLISYIFKINTEGQSDTQMMSFMKEVIRNCTLMMIMEAVGRNPELISRKLYKELESYSKVRLPFYKEFEEKMKSIATNLSEKQ